jgi:lipoate-protein ligase A
MDTVSRPPLILLDPEPPGNAFYNMALDECLLDAAARTGVEIWRLYTWFPPAVSIGRNQRVAEAVDIAFARDQRIDLVRRPTGGRAIWHSGDICFTNSAPLVASRATVAAFKDDYLRASGVLVGFLQSLGIAATISAGSPSSRRPGVAFKNPCFQSSGRFEITVKGKKIAGVSQFVSTGAYLIQGSIRLQPIDSASRKLFFREGADGDAAFHNLANQVTSIEEEIGECPCWDALDSAFSIAIGSHSSIDPNRQPAANIVDFDYVRKIENEKYRADTWNLRF